jgi:hypothetical protein
MFIFNRVPRIRFPKWGTVAPPVLSLRAEIMACIEREQWHAVCSLRVYG